MFHRHRWIVVGNEPWSVENVWTHSRKDVVVTGLQCPCGKRLVLEHGITMNMAASLFPLGHEVKP